ncbi:winged helix-turn-helix domain-containing protein [Roseateles depolymerans]|uniref:Putative transcriptional regulator, ModE family n=1 Tax=Roseateles depolymerans TaxID=76731 RepID=A0A0U3MK53_9BURK|nr:LysR family transcriptional regulator [Roseateles depolymerans]ALV04730.1 Putative transcriptional regulator, ModE family [Roseateles depolymerans]REG15259.1 molybdate transport system regulatory protein [Roseateles depolymerans]
MSAVHPEFKLRMRITQGEQVAIGPGKIALLEALDQAGSITAAAKALGMSYRRAWLLIDELNHALREPAVTTAAGGAQGGGSVLTDSGRALVALYRQIEARAQAHCADDIRTLTKMLAD